MIDAIKIISSVFMGWKGREDLSPAIVYLSMTIPKASRLYPLIPKVGGKRHKIIYVQQLCSFHVC